MDEFQLSFFVPSLPVPQPRPRVTVHAHRYAHAYTPSDHPVHDFRLDVRHECEQVYQDGALDFAFSLDLEFFFPRPASKIWKKQPMPRQYKITNPDLDNLVKPVKDALTGVVWTDDSRVVVCRCSKLIVAGTRLNGVYKSEPVGVDVRIRGLTLWCG